MSNITKNLTEESFFVYVKDSVTQKIKRVAFPSDIQIGTKGNPKELQLLGALSLATKDFVVSGKNYIFNLTDHDTIANITYSSTPNEVIVYLPANPRDGQIHYIKDADGIANDIQITVKSPLSNILIDNSTFYMFSDEYESIMLYWKNNKWQILMKTVSAGGGGGAPTNASYLTLSSNTTLTNERRLSVSGSNLALADNGPNNTAQLDLTSILGGGAGTYTYATVTADTFGRITAISSGTTPAPVNASYVVISNDATLTNERAIAVGLGLLLLDAGANSNLTIAINNNILATISGSTFTGPVIAQGGLSGSLQNIANGSSYLVAGQNITIVSQSNGQVVISSTTIASGSAGDGADKNASYIVVNNTASLPNERALVAGYGLTISDGGPNDNLIISFQGSLSASGGGPAADISASYIVIGNTASLPNERALVAGYGINFNDGGPNNSLIVSFAGSLSGSGISTNLGSAYYGYTTASVSMNNSSSWTDFLTGTNEHFQDNISRNITRNNSSFTINESGSYNFHASFNAYGSDAYITLRLSGSNGVVLQRSTYRSLPTDQNPAVLDGIFDAQPNTTWTLQYLSSGTIFPWTSSNPLVGDGNMWTGEVSIYKVQSDTQSVKNEFVYHNSNPAIFQIGKINVITSNSIISGTIPPGVSGSTIKIKKHNVTSSLSLYAEENTGIDNRHFIPLHGYNDIIELVHDGTKWLTTNNAHEQIPPLFSGSTLIGWWDHRVGVHTNSANNVTQWDAVLSQRYPLGISLAIPNNTSSTINRLESGLYFPGNTSSCLTGTIGPFTGATIAAKFVWDNDASSTGSRFIMYLTGHQANIYWNLGPTSLVSFLRLASQDYPTFYVLDNANVSVLDANFLNGANGNYGARVNVEAGSVNSSGLTRQHSWWRRWQHYEETKTGTISAVTGGVNAQLVIGSRGRTDLTQQFKGKIKQAIVYDRALHDDDLESITKFLLSLQD